MTSGRVGKGRANSIVPLNSVSTHIGSHEKGAVIRLVGGRVIARGVHHGTRSIATQAILQAARPAAPLIVATTNAPGIVVTNAVPIAAPSPGVIASPSPEKGLQSSRRFAAWVERRLG